MLILNTAGIVSIVLWLTATIASYTTGKVIEWPVDMMTSFMTKGWIPTVLILTLALILARLAGLLDGPASMVRRDNVADASTGTRETLTGTRATVMTDTMERPDATIHSMFDRRLKSAIAVQPSKREAVVAGGGFRRHRPDTAVAVNG